MLKVSMNIDPNAKVEIDEEEEEETGKEDAEEVDADGEKEEEKEGEKEEKPEEGKSEEGKPEDAKTEEKETKPEDQKEDEVEVSRLIIPEKVNIESDLSRSCFRPITFVVWSREITPRASTGMLYLWLFLVYLVYRVKYFLKLSGLEMGTSLLPISNF